MIAQRIMASIDGPRTLATLVAGLLLIAVSPPQNAQQMAKITGPRLRYRVIVSDPVICQGCRSIDLDLELENISDHKVSIDRFSLTYQVSISTEGRATFSTGDNFPGFAPGQLVTLAPRESYRRAAQYSPKGFDLRPGIYQVHVTYGQFVPPSPSQADLFEGTVDSNVVLFQVVVCSSRN